MPTMASSSSIRPTRLSTSLLNKSASSSPGPALCWTMSDSDRYRTSAARFQQSDSGIQHEQREIRTVHVRGRTTYQPLDLVDPIFLQRRLARALGGKTNPLQAAAEHFAELVLGCDRGYPHARIRKRRQNRTRGDERGIGDHHLPAGGFVEIVIARDAMHLRGRPGDNRHVVWIRECRHRGVGDSKEAFRHDLGNIGQQSGRKTMRNITRIAAVKTNDNGAGHGFAVDAPIDFDSVNALFGHWLSQRSREGTIR